MVSHGSEQRLDRLELDVLNMMFPSNDPLTEKLHRQIACAVVKSRESSLAGSFTDLEVTDKSLRIDRTGDIWFGDIVAKVPGVSQGVGFVVLIRDGLIDMLESYTFGEDLPSAINEYSLSYASGSSRNQQYVLDKLG